MLIITSKFNFKTLF